MKLKRLLILTAGVALSFGAFAQAPTVTPDPWTYYTGDRTGQDLTDANKRLVRGQGQGPYAMEGVAELEMKNFVLTLIDMNKGSNPLTPMAIGESAVSYQMVGSKLPYFVSLSQMAYPNLDSRQVYPPKADDGTAIKVESTWAWSLAGAANGAGQDILTGPAGVAVAGQLAAASADAGERNKKNYVGIDLATAKPGDKFNIRVDETYTGSNCPNNTGWAAWDVKNTSFGIQTTGYPLVGFDKTQLPGQLNSLDGKYVRYDANVKLAGGSGNLANAPAAKLAGKIVYMFAFCDKDAVTAISSTQASLGLLSYEQGIGTAAVLKRYAFTVAKTSVVVKADMSTEPVAGVQAEEISVTALAGVTASNLAKFENGADLDYGSLKDGTVSLTINGADMKNLTNATAPLDDVVAVDNIFLIAPARGLDAGTDGGVVSATSSRCDNPSKSASEKLKGYYGVEAVAMTKPSDVKMVPAIVIRHMMPPRTGPIYYVPNGLYAI